MVGIRHPARALGTVVTAVVLLAPLGLILYQSFLDAPFFMPEAKTSLDAYAYVLADLDFFDAFEASIAIALGTVAIALPLGSLLAFLMTRTDLPGRRWIEPALLSPLFVSSLVLAFGYVVSVGPVGFVSLWVKGVIGDVPWTLYSLVSLILIAGLTHVPHVYLYVSAALRNINPEVEEAARMAGAGVWRAAFTISLPLVMPALVFSATLVFLLGIEMFGLVLVIGDPAGIGVLTTYLYKLTNLLGTPSYQLMAVVAVAIVAMTLPLVVLQRRLLRYSGRYVTVRGKGMAVRPLPLGRWRWVAFALTFLWLAVTVVLPLSGIALRAFVTSWGEGVDIWHALTFGNFVALAGYPNLIRAIVNTVVLSTVGGALAVALYTAIALLVHRWEGGGARLFDYVLMTPRALPGLVAGLAFLWIFLFVPFLTPLRGSIASIWVAYTVVWCAYGLRLVTTALNQLGPELEEAARMAGAGEARVHRDITIPLLRFGLVAGWLLIFMAFCREYATGVYLLGPNTEVIGSTIISLFGGGSLDLIAALSLINVMLIGVGVATVLRLGVRFDA